MFRNLRPRSIYDVFAVLALVVAMGGTTAWATHETILSSDIVNGEVGSADVKDNSLNTIDVHSFIGADIVDGSLEDQDIAEGTFVHFVGNIGVVPANGCVGREVSGINAAGDHLLLTPDHNTSDGRLSYEIQYNKFLDTARLRVCNHTEEDVDDFGTFFNLLVIDAN
jgi:hypothetical protein